MDFNGKFERWPMHLEMVPAEDEIYDGAELLLASDCATYGYGFKTEEFKDGRVPVIGCHKADRERYLTKLVKILKNNNIKKVTILRIDLFCCESLEKDIREAVALSGKNIECDIYTVNMENQIKKL